MSNNADRRPVIVWVDDDLPGLNEAWIRRLMESQEMFAVEMFGNTGRAIEFTLENADRVFLFIQDSSRYKSRILTDWRAIRPHLRL
jgi:hypothetical protein